MGLEARLRIPPPFEDAVRDHEREIMRYVLRITGHRDDALDLFQETWLRAYRAYPSLKSAEGLRPWLFRIATNLCRNHARNNSRRARVVASGDCDIEALAGVATGRESLDGAMHIRKMVARLPHKQRLALMMRKFGGLDYSEIGAALECSAESARAGVYQALKKLGAAR